MTVWPVSNISSWYDHTALSTEVCHEGIDWSDIWESFNNLINTDTFTLCGRWHFPLLYETNIFVVYFYGKSSSWFTSKRKTNPFHILDFLLPLLCAWARKWVHKEKHLLPHYRVIQFLKTLISGEAKRKIKVIFKYANWKVNVASVPQICQTIICWPPTDSLCELRQSKNLDKRI